MNKAMSWFLKIRVDTNYFLCACFCNYSILKAQDVKILLYNHSGYVSKPNLNSKI